MADLIISHAARKDFRRLPRQRRDQIETALLALAGGSRADVTALTGTANERLRVGRYRVIFRREGESIVVLRMAPRGGAY